MKIFRKSYYLALAMSMSFCALAYAFDDAQVVGLTKQVMEAKNRNEIGSPLEELKVLFFKGHKYSEAVNLFNSLGQQKPEVSAAASFYVALCRYGQLQYLEETKSWDEYFNQGSNYREQFKVALAKALEGLAPQDELGLRARLLAWEYAHDQQEASGDDALAALMDAVKSYNKDSAASPDLFKSIADTLSAGGQKSKGRILYKMYVEKLAGSTLAADDLKNIAMSFFSAANLDLAEAVFDVYILKLQSQDATAVIPALVDIAKLFSYKDNANCDPYYAEQVFKKIQEIGTSAAFNEELLYLRAFNLEKSKEYAAAKEAYDNLTGRYPQGSHYYKALLKCGFICAYAGRDIKNAMAYFAQASASPEISGDALAAIYQQGLFSQWQGDNTQAQQYYGRLIEKAQEGYKDIVSLARQRIKEITEQKEMEYNLKTFLDASLKEENNAYDMSKADLSASRYTASADSAVDISVRVQSGESGCLEASVTYLWSGNLGSAAPSSEDPKFGASYSSSGTKVVNLVVVAPSGILDRSFILIDSQ